MPGGGYFAGKVVVGVVGLLGEDAIANFQLRRRPLRTIYQVMSIGHASGKTSHVTWL